MCGKYIVYVMYATYGCMYVYCMVLLTVVTVGLAIAGPQGPTLISLFWERGVGHSNILWAATLMATVSTNTKDNTITRDIL